MWLRKTTKLKSFIGFHSANKINNYNRWGTKRKKKNLQNKSKIKIKKCFSWVSAVRVLSLAGSHSPLYLPRITANILLTSGPAVGEAHILIWSSSCVFLPPVSDSVGLEWGLRICNISTKLPGDAATPGTFRNP